MSADDNRQASGGYLFDPIRPDSTRFDPVAFLREEIAALHAQLRAEREHVRRLSTAVAHLKEGCGMARGMMEMVKGTIAEGDDLNADAVKAVAEYVDSSLSQADCFLMPEAEEVPRG